MESNSQDRNLPATERKLQQEEQELGHSLPAGERMYARAFATPRK